MEPVAATGMQGPQSVRASMVTNIMASSTNIAAVPDTLGGPPSHLCRRTRYLNYASKRYC